MSSLSRFLLEHMAKEETVTTAAAAAATATAPAGTSSSKDTMESIFSLGFRQSLTCLSGPDKGAVRTREGRSFQTELQLPPLPPAATSQPAGTKPAAGGAVQDAHAAATPASAARPPSFSELLRRSMLAVSETRAWFDDAHGYQYVRQSRLPTKLPMVLAVSCAGRGGDNAAEAAQLWEAVGDASSGAAVPWLPWVLCIESDPATEALRITEATDLGSLPDEWASHLEATGAATAAASSSKAPSAAAGGSGLGGVARAVYELSAMVCHVSDIDERPEPSDVSSGVAQPYDGHLVALVRVMPTYFAQADIATPSPLMHGPLTPLTGGYSAGLQLGPAAAGGGGSPGPFTPSQLPDTLDDVFSGLAQLGIGALALSPDAAAAAAPDSASSAIGPSGRSATSTATGSSSAAEQATTREDAAAAAAASTPAKQGPPSGASAAATAGAQEPPCTPSHAVTTAPAARQAALSQQLQQQQQSRSPASRGGLVDGSSSSTSRDWVLFNDFSITPVEPGDVVDTYGGQKLPVLLYYTHVTALGRPEASQPPCVSPVVSPQVFQALCCSPPLQPPHIRLAPPTFTPLDMASEAPRRGSLYALDAEFVAITPPEMKRVEAGGVETVQTKQSRLGLGRVSVLRGDGPRAGVPCIDDYIRAAEPVFDYLTRFSGLAAGDLDPGSSCHHLTSLKAAYLKLRYLVDAGAVFVGHGLKKDFRMINIVVPPDQVIDTVELFSFKQQRKLSLRFLASYLLGEAIQADTHDSIEDARTALRLYHVYRDLTVAGTFQDKLLEMYRWGKQYGWEAVVTKDGVPQPPVMTAPPA